MNIDITAFRDSLISAFFLEDFYKFGHVHQYPKNITQVWLNCTPRYSLRPDPKPESVVFMGTQRLILEVLVKLFNETFFYASDKEIDQLVADYSLLFGENASIAHISQLYRYGRLPIDLYALPEGSSVPYGVPAIVMTNTQPWAYWVPNFLETLCSAELWGTCVSATTARQFRRLFIKKAFEWNLKNIKHALDPVSARAHVPYQGHDFSMRGMFGVHASVLSALGHLAIFKGTDTIPALFAARRWYGEPLPQGAYVPATEHSVMSAGSKDGEFETFERLLFETYPDAPFLSIVSDTWDLWKVCTDYLPRLKDRIMQRPGVLVIRPDSGDPVKIICGTCKKEERGCSDPPSAYGVAELLAKTFGTDASGLINKVRIIYGDGINLDRAERILDGLIAKGLSPANVVLGLGSFTYQHVTRDTDGWAWKATAVRLTDGMIVPIFKDPVTDDGGKRSCRGIPLVYHDGPDETGPYYLQPTIHPEMLDRCAFQKLFADGRFDESKFVTLSEIRARTAED